MGRSRTVRIPVNGERFANDELLLGHLQDTRARGLFCSYTTQSIFDMYTYNQFIVCFRLRVQNFASHPEGLQLSRNRLKGNTGLSDVLGHELSSEGDTASHPFIHGRGVELHSKVVFDCGNVNESPKLGTNAELRVL